MLPLTGAAGTLTLMRMPVGIVMGAGDLPRKISLGTLPISCLKQNGSFGSNPDRKGPSRVNIVPFYLLPMSGKQILEAVEEAAEMLEISQSWGHELR